MSNAPSPEAIAAGRDLALNEMSDVLDLVGSYARSAAEASYRGDLHTLEVHLRSLWACAHACRATFKEIKLLS